MSIKIFRQLVICGLLNALIIYFLSIEIFSIPPLGRFFNPFEGFWQIKEISNEKIAHTLANKAQITFDENRIPTIIAKNDKDLYFCQGYIVAKDRLCQLDFQSRAASGRLSEIFGEKCLQIDRLQRKKGLAELAKSAIVYLESNEEMLSVINSYVAGINAYIDSLSYKHFPIEHKLIHYKQKKFDALDVMNILVLLIDDMSGSSNSIGHTIDYYNLGEELFNLFYPDKLTELYPVIRIDKNIKNYTNTKSLPATVVPILPLELLNVKNKNLKSEKENAKGSNSWAVNSKKTYDKTSIYLANDPHLRISLPSIWYVNTLKSPSVQVTGFSVPGLPGIMIGSNKFVAWGITNSCLNIKGWYKILFKDRTKKEYYYDNSLLKTQTVLEQINIKNKKPFFETVLYTHLGPVVYDNNFPHSTGVTDLSMKWLSGSIANALICIHEINRASSYQAFESSVKHFVAPILNFSFASKEGDIAMHVAGEIPNIFYRQTKFIMLGTSSKYDWTSNIPYNDMPISMNPDNNFVSSANQRMTNDSYPYYYLHYNDSRYRNKRIHQILTRQNNFSINAIKKMQNDNFNQIAKDNLEFLFSCLEQDSLTTDELTLYKNLKLWNLSNEHDKIGPSIFREWETQIKNILFEELYPCVIKPSTYRTFDILKNKDLFNLLDLKNYKNPSELIKIAFSRAVNKLKQFEKNKNKPFIWGNYCQFTIEHLYMIKPFSLYDIKVDGGKDSINANEGNSGASMRMIVEFNGNSEGPNIFYVYPGGQSGNPFSKYYNNLVDSWKSGVYYKLSIQ